MKRAVAALLLILALGTSGCHRIARVAGAVVVTAAAVALEAALYHHYHTLACGCEVYCEVAGDAHHYGHRHY